MEADQRIRRKMLGLSLLLLLLSVIDACGGHWMLPFGCAYADAGNCSQQVVEDVTSTSGVHAKVVTRHCTYKHRLEAWNTMVFLDHVPGLEKDLEFRSDGSIAAPTVFTGWHDPQAGAPPLVNVQWRSANDLVIGYPAGTGHMCNQWKGIAVHCVERGFSASQ